MLVDHRVHDGMRKKTTASINRADHHRYHSLAKVEQWAFVLTSCYPHEWSSQFFIPIHDAISQIFAWPPFDIFQPFGHHKVVSYKIGTPKPWGLHQQFWMIFGSISRKSAWDHNFQGFNSIVEAKNHDFVPPDKTHPNWALTFTPIRTLGSSPPRCHAGWGKSAWP